MNSRTKANGFRLALILAAFFSYYMAICQYRLLIQSPITYQIVGGGAGGSSLTKADYENIQETQQKEESDISYALWRKTDGLTVENPKWNRASSISLWTVWGNLEVLFDQSVKLQEEDTRGCYLDAQTAQELFGSTEVVGSEIVCEGRTFTIRGILQEEKALMVIRPRQTEATDRVTLGNLTSLEAESFQMRYGIEGSMANPFFLRGILQMLLFLFPVGLALSFPKKNGLRWLLLLCLAYLFVHQVQIPETMIPDKWSNFQFWADWWKAAGENIAAYVRQDKTGRELAQIACFLKGAICSLIPLCSVFLLGK